MTRSGSASAGKLHGDPVVREPCHFRKARCQLRMQRCRHVGYDELPALQLEREQFVEPPGCSQLALRDDRDAIAQRLGVGQDVRAEEHGAAARAKREDQIAHVTTAQRIEARHRLVEEHDLGIVQQRLRQADALDHAFRELPQPQPPFMAETHLIEHARDARPRIR